MPFAIRVKLSAMMFLQYLMMPVWFLALGKYMAGLEGSAPWMFWVFNTMAFGMMASPVVCMFADKFLNSERMLLICDVTAALGLFGAAYTSNPGVVFACLLVTMLFYMPTWSITAAVAMAHATPAAFPQIRVFGSMGWAAAALFGLVAKHVFGAPEFESTRAIFLCGGGVALASAALTFFLPPTVPKGRNEPMSVANALGLRAFVLFKRPEFAIFAVLFFCSMLPFQWYNSWTVPYLHLKGFELGVSMMSWGQVAEMAFLLLIPVILRKAGYKWALVLGVVLLAARYGAFYLGAAVPGLAGECGDMVGILLHGLVFGLTIVGAQMYVAEIAPPEIRNQAQGLAMLISSGLGVLASNYLFGKVVPLDKPTLPLFARGYLVALAIAAAVAVLMAMLLRPDDKRTPKE